MQEILQDLELFEWSPENLTVSPTYWGCLSLQSWPVCQSDTSIFGPKDEAFPKPKMWLNTITWSEVAQSCPTLCNPTDCSLPGSCVHGIFPARVLEWTAISFSRGSSWPKDRTRVSRIVDRCFTVWITRGVNLHVFMFFVIFFLWLMSNLIVLGSDRTWVSRIVGRLFTVWATREALIRF